MKNAKAIPPFSSQPVSRTWSDFYKLINQYVKEQRIYFVEHLLRDRRLYESDKKWRILQFFGRFTEFMEVPVSKIKVYPGVGLEFAIKQPSAAGQVHGNAIPSGNFPDWFFDSRFSADLCRCIASEQSVKTVVFATDGSNPDTTT